MVVRLLSCLLLYGWGISSWVVEGLRLVVVLVVLGGSIGAQWCCEGSVVWLCEGVAILMVV